MNLNYSTFVNFFNARYNQLKQFVLDLIPSKKLIRTIKQIDLTTNDVDETFINPFYLIVRVNEVIETSNNFFLQVEDFSGIKKFVIVKDQDIKLINDLKILVPSIAIGLKCNLFKKIKIEQIIWPGQNLLQKSTYELLPTNIELGIISDIHAGSFTFKEEAFNNLINALNLQKTLKYLIIAGDCIEGYGIFRDQENDLKIKNVIDQYALFAKYINLLRSDIRVFIAPGNHDWVPLIEPQPSLKLEVQKLFNSNVTFLKNPDNLCLEKRYILIYHGRSMDSFVRLEPFSYNDPGPVMEHMLRLRHLGPFHNSRSVMMCTPYDSHVIQEIPDILITGHVHSSAILHVGKTLCINAGTWQDYTHLQKRTGIKPAIGNIIFVNLGTLHAQSINFL